MNEPLTVGVLWTLFGVAGGLIFYGRFYVQWIASERAGRSVMPVAFWYMSSAGSVMLVAYAFASQSPLGALGQTFNIVIYSRNLVHIWREQGRLTPAINVVVHTVVGMIAVVAVGLMLRTWWSEYQLNADRPTEEIQQVWFWLAVGVAGQVLFAARSIVQWLTTEWRKRSVVPNIFWYLSFVAATLQASCFVQRAEWVFAAGMIGTILIYGRNIWFVRGEDESKETSE